MLWGRAGGRCSLCRLQLTTVDQLGVSSVIGEEAHMVARSGDGPRGASPLTIEQRDSYSNLILLCPNHHAEIDDLPSGPSQFPIERLQNIKVTHEEWVAGLSTYDANLQSCEERWAALIDALDSQMSWDTWTDDTSLLFAVEQGIAGLVYDRLRGVIPWILGRIWPPGHEYLRSTIEVLAKVLNDLLVTFEIHMTESHQDGWLATEKFYKIRHYDEAEYSRLLADYEFHTALVEDLAFELTRYGNLLCDIVRDEIDSSYRFAQGALLVKYGVDIVWGYSIYRPEFTDAEIQDQRQPYVSLDDFRTTRAGRLIGAAVVGNSRTVARRQDLEGPQPAD